MQDRLRESLIAGITELHLAFTNDMLEKQLAHLFLLEKWNRVYNLTAVRLLPDMIYKHVLDSLSVAPFWGGSNLADIGTGGGFPGIPLAILYPDRLVTLVEVNQKRIIFLKQVVRDLALHNVEVIQLASHAYQPSALFESVISRAFSDLTGFIQETEHLLAREGVLLAMKGHLPESELVVLPTTWQRTITPIKVPGLQEARHLVTLKRCEPSRNPA